MAVVLASVPLHCPTNSYFILLFHRGSILFHSIPFRAGRRSQSVLWEGFDSSTAAPLEPDRELARGGTMNIAIVHPGLVRCSSRICVSTVTESSPLGCSDCRLQRRRTSVITTRGPRLKRQSNHGTICRVSGKGHTRLSQKERSGFEGWLSRRHGYKHEEHHRSSVVAGAVPTGVTGVATLLVVAGSLYALLQLNKDKLQAWQARKECDMCSGSGLCPACNGEGFTMRTLSPEAAAKARAKARDAATRYTAGLAKKWNYCQTCQGVRLCPSCQGRGWLE